MIFQGLKSSRENAKEFLLYKTIFNSADYSQAELI